MSNQSRFAKTEQVRIPLNKYQTIAAGRIYEKTGIKKATLFRGMIECIDNPCEKWTEISKLYFEYERQAIQADESISIAV